MLHIDHLKGEGFDGGIYEIVNALFGGGDIGVFHGYYVDDGLGNIECFTNFIECALAGALLAGLYLREGCLRELRFFREFELTDVELAADGFDCVADIHGKWMMI